jgi:hypothetical protein
VLRKLKSVPAQGAARDDRLPFHNYFTRPALRPHFCERGALSRRQLLDLRRGLQRTPARGPQQAPRDDALPALDSAGADLTQAPAPDETFRHDYSVWREN